MKQIIQNYRKGTLLLEDVPIPICKSNGVLVKTHFSAVSVGTEKMKLENAAMNYLQMAKAKPDQVKQALTTLRQLGPVATYRKVMKKHDCKIENLYYNILSIVCLKAKPKQQQEKVK